MIHGRELFEEAVRLHEKHAEHARQRGDEQTARKAEERAKRARERAHRTPAETPPVLGIPNGSA